jgi:hypothetical protein
MTASEFAAALLTVSALAFCGWICLFKTSMLVGWGRGTYARSRVTRAYPFSSKVQKSWYPTCLRCMGIFAWMLDAALTGMFILTAVRR